jgi:dTDP-4-dehydrorhamnose reductase
MEGKREILAPRDPRRKPLSEMLLYAWERYRRPVAITEAHLDSSPNEQVRWLSQLWREVSDLQRLGVDARAVTIWSLFGAWNWHCLVTREEDRYEPGAFDIRGPAPSPTALATLAQNLAARTLPAWTPIEKPGWWERSERLLYPPLDREGNDVVNDASRDDPQELAGAA